MLIDLNSPGEIVKQIYGIRMEPCFVFEGISRYHGLTELSSDDRKHRMLERFNGLYIPGFVDT